MLSFNKSVETNRRPTSPLNFWRLFVLDPRMVAIAQRRLSSRGLGVRLWVGDAAAINAPDAAYDAVFDFGMIHHVPNWRDVLAEVHRVLRPGGQLYAEEPVGGVLNHPLMHRLFAHPRRDQFDAADFRSALRASGLIPLREEQLWHTMFWFVASKLAAAQSGRRGDFSPRLPHHRTCGSASGGSWQSLRTKQHSFSATMIAAQCTANRLHRTWNKTTDGRVLPAKCSPSRVVRPSGIFVSGSSALTSGFLPTESHDSAVASV
jgi:hypothetical protein